MKDQLSQCQQELATAQVKLRKVSLFVSLRIYILHPVHTDPDQCERTYFLPVQPVYTGQCKFCYSLQYCLPFINFQGSTGPE